MKFFSITYAVLAWVNGLLWLVNILNGGDDGKRAGYFAASIALIALSQIAYMRKE